MTKVHSKEILSRLRKLETQQDEIVTHSAKMLKADNGNFFTFDLLAIGALKRTKSMLAGFEILIESWNLLAARALIRMHLDTLMRFYAGWLVKDPHSFARKVLDGERMNRIKDKNGKYLRDKYLAEKMTEKYDWVLRVYQTTCGYIHLSDRHMFAAMKPVKEDRECEIRISSEDENYPESSYVEALDCFLKITDIFLLYVRGWTATKSKGLSTKSK